MKKILSIILAVVLLVSIMPMGLFSITASAATYGDLTYEISDGKVYITDCDESVSGEMVIPSTIKGYPVTWIYDYAFENCKALTSVVIPNTVTKIGYAAFQACNSLREVNIPDGLKILDQLAFCECYKLESIIIPGGVANIADFAFRDCSNLTNVVIEEGVKGIGINAFANCGKLESVILPETIVSIGVGAFIDCINLASINLPDSIIEISISTFRRCYSLQEITIPKNVIIIGDTAFSETSIKTAVIPGSVTKIGTSAFEDCKFLESVIIANGVNEICDSAFSGCSNLETVVLPKTLKKIGHWAFYGCLAAPTYYGGLVFYTGTESQKQKINIADYGNNNLINTSWDFNTCDVDEHSYKAKCSVYCEKCSWFGRDTENAKHTLKTKVIKATTSDWGWIYKECSLCGHITSRTEIFGVDKVKLSTTTYTYNGKVKTPTVTVKDWGGKVLKKNKDYKVTYASGRKNVGKYKVTVTFKGNYSGTKTLYFTINPAKTTVSKLTAGKKSIKVAITKKSTQVTGYQIQYSTSKTFKSAKTKTITSYKTTSTTLTKLSAKKTYYVRVRTYKTVGKTKYYSGWSTYKSAKTK